MTDEVDYRVVSETAGVLMYSGNCSVSRKDEDPSLEVVHFIYDSRSIENGLYKGILVDKDYKKISNKIFLFESVDEFLTLAVYMFRNGVVVTV